MLSGSSPMTDSRADSLLDVLIDKGSPRAFQAFFRRAWQVVEPKPLVWGPHLTVLCDELQQVPEKTRTLVICIPPGFSKSLLVSVIWPAYYWLIDPSIRYLAVSNTPTVANRDSRRMRELIQSDWYKERQRKRGRPDFGIKDDKNEATNYELANHGGARICLPIRGAVTGVRCDMLIVDDPIDAKDALGSPALVKKRVREANAKISVALDNRLNDEASAVKITIMQRICHGDPAHVALQDLDETGRAVVLPMEYDPHHEYRYDKDWRTESGELLHPARFTKAGEAKRRRKMGERHYRAQYLQATTESVGGLFFKRHFERRHEHSLNDWTGDELVVSADLTFKKSKGSDCVAIGIFGRCGSTVQLLEVVNEPMTFTESVERIASISMRVRWRCQQLGLAAPRVYVEDKANGPALLDLLRGRLPVPLVAVNPQASKYERAQLVLSCYEAQAIELPEDADWVDSYIEQHTAFTGEDGGADDMVDMTTQALSELGLYDMGDEDESDILDDILDQFGGW